MKTAILISSCPKYEALARWTGGQIDRHWGGHPPVFFSGLHGTASDMDLPMMADERDWMAVTLDAVEELQHRGFTHSYLILDDHPPFGKCDENFLNTRLPETAARLGALYVGLLGYGQRRAVEGEILEGDNLFLERTSPAYRWKFSLHPGLWELKGLETLLRVRVEQYPTSAHTPWSFERHRDEPSQLPEGFLGRSYRVKGSAFDGAPDRVTRMLKQSATHLFFDLALFAVRLMRGREVREKMSASWLWAYAYYRGPYPLFWSGVMMQGRPNPHLVRFLKFSDPGGLRSSIGKIFNSLS